MSAPLLRAQQHRATKFCNCLCVAATAARATGPAPARPPRWPAPPQLPAASSGPPPPHPPRRPNAPEKPLPAAPLHPHPPTHVHMPPPPPPPPPPPHTHTHRRAHPVFLAWYRRRGRPDQRSDHWSVGVHGGEGKALGRQGVREQLACRVAAGGKRSEQLIARGWRGGGGGGWSD